MILRVAIGFSVAAMGLLLPWLPVVDMTRNQDFRALRALIPGGLAMCLTGGYFAYYAWLEWWPRGFAVGLCRRGLVCKVNSVRCPRLLAIQWRNIESATYKPPRWFGLCAGQVKVQLRASLPTFHVAGRLPESGGGVRRAGRYTILLGGWWETWHPADVANLIEAAATDSGVRESLSERRVEMSP